MSDQRIGTATVCLTAATLPYALLRGCTRPYPHRHERRVGADRARGADPALWAPGAGPRPGCAAAGGPGAGPGGLPAGPATGAGAVGGALGALAGLPAAG